MSNSLTDVYNKISSHDAALLEKQAAAIKVAEEEDAAGRIMARGFADELSKLAAPAGGVDAARQLPKIDVKNSPMSMSGMKIPTMGQANNVPGAAPPVAKGSGGTGTSFGSARQAPAR